MNHNLPTLVVVGLATVLAVARLTRLVTGDTITEPARTWLDRKAAPRPQPDGTVHEAPEFWRFFSALTHCHWCASVWVAVPSTEAYLAWATGTPPWDWGLPVIFLWAVGALGTSHAVATAADWLDSPPPVKPLDVHIRRDDSS